jgi:hypothetical protein
MIAEAPHDGRETLGVYLAMLSAELLRRADETDRP